MLLRLKPPGSFSAVMVVSFQPSKTLLVIDSLVEAFTAVEIPDSIIEPGGCCSPKIHKIQFSKTIQTHARMQNPDNEKRARIQTKKMYRSYHPQNIQVIISYSIR